MERWVGSEERLCVEEVGLVVGHIDYSNVFIPNSVLMSLVKRH